MTAPLDTATALSPRPLGGGGSLRRQRQGQAAGFTGWLAYSDNPDAITV